MCVAGKGFVHECENVWRLELKKEELARRVKELSGLHHTSEAEQATRTVLDLLAGSIPQKEANDLASQLPEGYKDVVHSGAGLPRRKADWGTYVNRVRSDMALDTRQQAEQAVAGVFAALREAVTPGELEDIVSELPPQARRIVEPA